MAQRSSRKRRKERRRAREATGAQAQPPAVDGSDDRMARGYARGRAKDDAARAALKPLAEGERPTAVTVGAVAAGVLFVANLVAMLFGYNSDDGGKLVSGIAGCVLLAVMGVGMWRGRYWAVLGMQALLAITIILSALALMAAVNVGAALLAVGLILGAGTLFWFLVKAMARIQMPERPGAREGR